MGVYDCRNDAVVGRGNANWRPVLCHVLQYRKTENLLFDLL